MKKYKDKIGILKKVKKGEKIVLELGCGKKKKPGRINVDILDLEGVDIVANLEEGFEFLPDNSVDEIHSSSLFEHIDNFRLFMEEIHRVLKPGGKVFIFVPHFSNPYFYSDYTHKRFMGFYTFYYFASDQSKLKRKVPAFYTDFNFDIDSILFTFSSPFYPISLIKKAVGRIINSSLFFQEFFEVHLSKIFSAYGMDVIISKPLVEVKK